jgi:tRNA threonylcarbamoyladenosine biosynthesis protein TsaE
MAIGVAWGQTVTAGSVIGLNGELGAGKTQLVKGLALGLGSTAHVHSPTFALLHEYAGGRLPLFHLDLYRLETPAQIRSAGLDDYLFRPDGVTVVEWFERAAFPRPGTGVRMPPAATGRRLREVWIEIVSDTQRRLTYEDSGG